MSNQVQNWKSSDELLAEIRGITKDLREGKIEVKEARAIAQMMSASVKLIQAQLEHARLTGRLGKTNVLPAFVIGGAGTK